MLSRTSSTAHSAVLITSISRKMPLIAAVRNAANRLGAFQRLHGCDSQKDCIGQYGVDAFWHCPSLEHLTVEEVLTYCLQHDITAIIPTRDADLEFYAFHHPRLQSEGIHVMVSPLETIALCLDKYKFANFLLKEHFPVIPAFLSLDQLKSPSYVVKEKKGAGSRHVGLRLTKEEAKTYSQHLQDPIFQPYIQGQEWSVDVYCSRQGNTKGCVARQRNQTINGESQVTTTFHDAVLEEICQRMAEKLHIQGHAVFQLMEKDKGDFHVIECNPRFGGASTASLAVGLDSFFWFFIEILGLNLKDYPFIRRKGEIRQIRYATDRILPWSSSLT